VRCKSRWSRPLSVVHSARNHHCLKDAWTQRAPAGACIHVTCHRGLYPTSPVLQPVLTHAYSHNRVPVASNQRPLTQPLLLMLQARWIPPVLAPHLLPQLLTPPLLHHQRQGPSSWPATPLTSQKAPHPPQHAPSQAMQQTQPSAQHWPGAA
jgi:hypothetical protein